MKIEVLTGPQGGGKSRTMRDETIANPGLYLFALPTTELIDEQAADFWRAKPTLKTVKVYAQPNLGKTADRLAAARREIEAQKLTHAVIFTTHATLMDHSLDGFDDWHARIDEAPAAIQAGKFNIGVSSRHWLEKTFDLICSPGSEWSALRLKGAAPNWNAVDRDAGSKPFAEFIKQAKQPDRVFVKAQSWDDKDDIDWFSMWTPLALSHLKSVQIAGSSYTDSIGFKAAESLFSDVFGVMIRQIAPPRTGQPDIDIHYFTRGHEGTTSIWSESPGRSLIKQVCDHLAKVMPKSGFWSGNGVVEVLMDHRLKAKFIKPLAMGLNKHRSARHCAFIYSAKATSEDAPVMEVFNLTKDDIRRAREDDTIAQFVMRGAIRNLDEDKPYTIYLYSEGQAERLRDHLAKIGFTKIKLIPVDEAGIMEATKPTAGRPSVSAEERAAKVAAAKTRDAQRKRDKRAAAAEAGGFEPHRAGRRRKSPVED